MKHLLLIFAFLPLAFACSSKPTSTADNSPGVKDRFPASAESITIRGSKAQNTLKLLNEVGADVNEDPCTMGSCYASGTLQINCKFPNGPNPQKRYYCDVTGSKTTKSLEGSRALRLMGLMDAAGANNESDDNCAAGSCFQVGALAVRCQSENGSGAGLRCELSSAVAKKEAAQFKPKHLVHSVGKAYTECQDAAEQEQKFNKRKVCVNADGDYYYLAN